MADEQFTRFLDANGLAGKKVLTVFLKFGVVSLSQLAKARQDDAVFQKIKRAFDEGNLSVNGDAFSELTIEAIENAIHFKDAENDGDELVQFLRRTKVLASTEKSRRDELLHIFWKVGAVDSLTSLKKLKDRGKDDKELVGLTQAIAKWNAAAGIEFAKITRAQVAQAARGPVEATGELQAFLKTQRFPAGCEEVLVENNITTLEDLRSVCEDDEERAALRGELENAGIRGATAQFDAVKLEDIDRAIAVAQDPNPEQDREKINELTDAIERVEQLRSTLAAATREQFDEARADVIEQYDRVIGKVKDVCKLDFERADKAADLGKAALDKLFEKTITNVKGASQFLQVSKKTLPMADIMRDKGMLCGFLISTDEITCGQRLVALPKKPDKLATADVVETSDNTHYVGNSAQSFAIKMAREASLTIAGSSTVSGAGFTGAGLAAVSAAASYADAHMESLESERFGDSRLSECGRLDYAFVPKKRVRFRESELVLSDNAKQSLARIAKLKPEEWAGEVVKFYREFGSHFFLEQLLGGRYELLARGTTRTETNKGVVITAVSDTANWASSAAGSYAGIAGAHTAAAAIEGKKGSASAQAERFALQFERCEVNVAVTVCGGAGTMPKDLWRQSLYYNSTWAVIGRGDAIGVWDIVRNDPSVDAATKELVPAMERTWVREIFGESVKKACRPLYDMLVADASVTTCGALDRLLGEFSGKLAEKGIEVFVVKATSAASEHPEVTAVSHAAGMKLIGGAAFVDYEPGEAGNLLTGSFPEKNGWRATAKSHYRECKAQVTAYAIYLYDPYDLWEVKFATGHSAIPSDRPTAVATLPADYAMTGGGARVEWKDWGLLLTDCGPDPADGHNKSWIAKGKDHRHAERGTVTAWVFGVKPRATFVQPLTMRVDQVEKANDHRLDVAAPVPAGRVIVGGGASVSYGGNGGLLVGTGLADDFGSWKAAAKDHVDEDTSIRLRTWVISAVGKPHSPS